MDWLNGIAAAVTICDNDGIIIYMNARSEQVFQNDGGRDLLGKSLFGCHPEPALTHLKEMLQQGITNTYTIEKNGVRKLIHQSPWHTATGIGGMVEVSIELPADMKHFQRT